MIDASQMEGIEPLSLIVLNDFDANTYTGTQDASFFIMARDVYDVGEVVRSEAPPTGGYINM